MSKFYIAKIALTPAECKARCSDGGLDNCTAVSCPCGCGGKMLSDGRNIMNNLTFLQCDTCRCTYVAEDKAKVEKTT